MKALFEHRNNCRISNNAKPMYYVGYTGNYYPYYDKIMENVQKYDAKQLQLQTNIEIITVVQYGLKCVDEGQEYNCSIIINWLIENLYLTEDKKAYLLIWKDKREYQIRAPWVSGMLQGQLLSLFTRFMHVSIKDKKIAKSMEYVFNTFGFDDTYTELSFNRKLNDRFLIEEYPVKEKTTFVLNGNIFAIFGLVDYNDFVRDKRSNIIIEETLGLLREYLNNFNIKGWSIYDLYKKNYATLEYHWLHVAQLRALYFITDDVRFKDLADIWEAKINRFNVIYFQIRMRINQIARKIKSFSL